MDKITVVMNSPDEQLFKIRPVAAPETASRERFVVMYHGSLVERNGLDLAVKAISKIRSRIPGIELKIYGAQNAFSERVMRLVEERGLSDCVRYMGPRRVDGIPPAIEECDLGIVPNRRSMFTELNTPTRIFEYLALGKPVIAPRAPGICDYFDADSLLYFNLGDSDDLAEKIEYVFRNPIETARTTAKGQRVHEAHSWQQERQKLLDLLERIV